MELDVTTITDTRRKYLDVGTGKIRTGEIVTAMDALSDVNAESARTFNLLAAEKQERNDAPTTPSAAPTLTCEECGKTSPDVERVEDPYAKEIHNKN